MRKENVTKLPGDILNHGLFVAAKLQGTRRMEGTRHKVQGSRKVQATRYKVQGRSKAQDTRKVRPFARDLSKKVSQKGRTFKKYYAIQYCVYCQL